MLSFCTPTLHYLLVVEKSLANGYKHSDGGLFIKCEVRYSPESIILVPKMEQSTREYSYKYLQIIKVFHFRERPAK